MYTFLGILLSSMHQQKKKFGFQFLKDDPMRSEHKLKQKKYLLVKDTNLEEEYAVNIVKNTSSIKHTTLSSM